jgi:hypothetical protein
VNSTEIKIRRFFGHSFYLEPLKCEVQKTLNQKFYDQQLVCPNFLKAHWFLGITLRVSLGVF